MSPKIVSDGLGGACVVWDDYSIDPTSFEPKPRVYGQHITSFGTIASGWPANGLQICSNWSGVEGTITDGLGGCLVLWGDARRGATAPDLSDLDVYGQHLLTDGSIAPGWQTDGN